MQRVSFFGFFLSGFTESSERDLLVDGGDGGHLGASLARSFFMWPALTHTLLKFLSFSLAPSLLPLYTPTRWAFVDFHLPEQCTRALLNVRNHSLDGRTLNVEYASSEAVRRGGLGTRAAGPGAGRGGARGGRGGGRGGGEMGGGGRPAKMEKKGRDWDDQDVRESAKVDYLEQPEVRDFAPRPRSEFGFRPSAGGPSDRGGRGGSRGGRGGRGGREESGVRAKPGAALAGAQRASTSIVESTGRKITFD